MVACGDEVVVANVHNDAAADDAAAIDDVVAVDGVAAMDGVMVGVWAIAMLVFWVQ